MSGEHSTTVWQLNEALRPVGFTVLSPIVATESCWCTRCSEVLDVGKSWNERRTARMILCPGCGNKRCPAATDHRLRCTRSNEPGQAGSSYE